MNDAATSLVGRLVDKARTAIRDIGARHALRQELLECDRRGMLDGLLADINLNRGELERLTSNYPLSAKLFGAMAARLGVDPSRSDAMTRQGLQHTCALCAHQSECRHWLDSGRSEGYEQFCPNSDYWHALKARVAASAPRR